MQRCIRRCTLAKIARAFLFALHQRSSLVHKHKTIIMSENELQPMYAEGIKPPKEILHKGMSSSKLASEEC